MASKCNDMSIILKIIFYRNPTLNMLDIVSELKVEIQLRTVKGQDHTQFPLFWIL